MSHPLDPNPRPRRERVAIVGMACRLANGADLAAFAERLLGGGAAGEPSTEALTGDSTTAEVIVAALRDAGSSAGVADGRKVEFVVGRGGAMPQATGRRADSLAPIGLEGAVRVDVRGEAAGLVGLDVGVGALRSRRADVAVVVEAWDRPGDEGVGVVVLKRLADAEHDGDRVYAVVRSVAFVPTGHRARRAGLRFDRRHGLAGIIESAMALHHRVRPAPSSTDAARPWVHGDSRVRRRAEVHGGEGNDVARATLEGHASCARADAPGVLMHWETEAILLGAPDRSTWIELARALIDWLDRRPDVALKDVAYTLNTGQPRFAFRVGLVVGSPEELAERLRWLVDRLADPERRVIRDARGTYFREEPLAGPGRLAFLFPGEGSQYPGMLADLAPHFPEVSALLDTSDRVARERGLSRLPSEALYGGGDAPELWSVELAINVVLTAQWALYQLLVRLGLRPDAVVGHSSGEFLALAAAGALKIDRTFEDRIGDLGAVFERHEADGALPIARLIAVAADRARVEAACREVGGPLRMAMDNCPHQVVVAGAPAPVDALVSRLKAEGIVCETLPFGRAYHTPEFAPALGPVREFLATLPIARPALPIYSCATASRMPDDPAAIRRLAAEQWARTVEFRSTIEALHADGVRLFVEVGARGNLTGFVEDTLRGRPQFAVAANLPRRSGLTQLNHLVAALYAQGVPVSPDHLYARRRPNRVDFAAEPAPKPKSREHAVAAVSANGQHEPPASNGSARHAGPVLAIEPLQFDAEPALDTDDEAMRSYLRTMDAFLATQREVMTAYLSATADSTADAESPGVGPEPVETGPWLGAIQHLDPGRELVAVRRLDVRDDPVAENHTLGGRRVSAIDPDRKGLPVLPFAVMTEMLAEAAAPLASGQVLVALRDVRAHRWIKYEDEPVTLETRARAIPGEVDTVRVQVFNRGTESSPRDPAEGPVVEGVAVFAEARPEGPMAPEFVLAEPGPCRFTAEELYRDQWLFHGPPFRALTRVGLSSPDGIEGHQRVLSSSALLRAGENPRLHIDPIALDVFTHLLGCWGLDKLSEGDVIFPLGLGELSIFAPDPPEGSEIACRIRIEAVERRRVRVAADLVAPDGRVWMRLKGWEDWRFYWPACYRDVFRAPDRVLVGEPLPTPDGLAAVWVEPPADMTRPVWRDVLEWIQLGPAERAELSATSRDDAERNRRLFGRIAAKEAVRRLRLGDGGSPCFPADLVVEGDELGLPRLRSLANGPPAAIAIASRDGVAVALAAADPRAGVGVSLGHVAPSSPQIDVGALTEPERLLVAQSPEPREWLVRVRCAREAASKVGCIPNDRGPVHVEALELDAATGHVLVCIHSPTGGETLRVTTLRLGGNVAAWCHVPGRNP